MFLKIIRNILMGFGVSAIATLSFCLISLSFGVETIELTLMNKQLIGSMLFGAFCGIIVFIYDLEKLSLLLRTALHFCLLTTGFLIVGTALKWFYGYYMLISVLSFLVLYIVIWVIQYNVNVRLVNQLNSEINNQ